MYFQLIVSALSKASPHTVFAPLSPRHDLYFAEIIVLSFSGT